MSDRRFMLLLLLASIFLAGSSSSAQPKKDKSGGEIILPPDQQRKLFMLPEGFEVELVAVEPAVINPITMALDEKGRLYVSEGHTYRYGPKGSPVEKPTNPIVRLDRTEDGKGWKRTIVAEGFDDPVMGLLVRGGKLWCTACDHIYVYDIDDAGKTSNRKEIVTDKVKAWNPFGFFVLEWGPDDMMYVSVGNHAMQVVGPTNELKSRGSSGIIMRMKPDGSQMEKLVEGLRVPYSFEFDPFGQLWVISNGQGNPDRHVKVIDGVEYHCYTRPKLPAGWLAGKHPLAPPCLEITNGARTQMLHYYGANFPKEYWGRQFGVNWGPHGVGTRNHAIEQFVVDDRERVTKTDNWLTCDDVRFRPTQIMLDSDGSILMADWYGRDDENDLTGRIWRVKYTGKDAPRVDRLKETEWKDEAKVLEALGSLDHLERERAIQTLTAKGASAIHRVAETAATSKNPMAAANALWVLARIGSDEAKKAMSEGTKNSDWKVRRLALRLLKRWSWDSPFSEEAAKSLLKTETDGKVIVDALPLARAPTKAVEALLTRPETSSDPHLTYETAKWFGLLALDTDFRRIFQSENGSVRIAGLIAIDIALYEQSPNKGFAKQALLDVFAHPEKFDITLLIDLASLHPDPAMIPTVQKYLEQTDLKPEAIAEASKLLRILAGPNKAIKNPWLEMVKSGKIPLSSPDDRKTILKLLPDDGPTPFALDVLKKLLVDGDAKGVVLPAAEIARSWEGKSFAVADVIWKQLANPKLPLEVRIELVGTLAAIDPFPSDVKRWRELLSSAEPAVAREIVRDFRRFPKEPVFRDVLTTLSPALLKKDESLKHDLALTLFILGDQSAKPELGPAIRDAKEYLDFGTKNFKAKPSPEQFSLGRLAFERANCAKCHLLNENEKIGPTLGGVGRHQLAHVVESILEPSKIILTGYEVERIETKNGVFLNGIVREKGNQLTVINAEKMETVLKKDIAERMLQKTSIMPDGIEKWISREEFADLLSFVMTHKANVGPPIPKKK